MGGGDAQEVKDAVKRLQVVLDNSSVSSREEVLSALEELQSLGSLPMEVLKETLVGKSLHSLAKAAEDPNVKSKAKNLELLWRQDFKKRKASSEDLQLRRSNSNVSEGTAAALFASQDTGLSRTRSFSQDEENQARETARSEAQEKKDETYREKVRQKLIEALGKEEELEARGGEERQSMQDPVKLAEEIEEELNKVLPKKEDYMNQARSILFNLKDSKNPTFRFKLMVGFFQPQQLPKLTAEDMASEQKNDERRKQRKYAMEALDQGWALKNGQQPTTGMFTCGKCKGNKTTYFQMQTRSSDEPMTTFVTCLTCSNRWKFC